MGTPFDLHVLSTPPAFILSQDQTLNKMVSKQLSLFKSFSLIVKSLTFKNSKKKNVAPQSFKLHGQLVLSVWCFVFLLRCLIYKVHAALAGELYFTTTQSLCQEVFSSFLPAFSPLSCDSFDRIPRPSRNVNPFFRFFPTFFLPPVPAGSAPGGLPPPGSQRAPRSLPGDGPPARRAAPGETPPR